MMQREDYLTRQIRDFARVLARILGFRKGGQTAEALAACEEGIASASQLDPRIVRSFRAADVIALMGGSAHVDPGRVKHLVELLRIEAEIHEEEGRGADAAALRAQADAFETIMRPPSA